MGELMKIIAHRNIKYNYDDFITSTVNNPIIMGVTFDILMTKDQKILIYTPDSNYIKEIDSIQSNTYQNLKKYDVITLEEVLTKFINTNQKIILNLLPLVSSSLTDDNIQSVNELNVKYIDTVNSIINKFPNLEFYLCSGYDNLLYILMQRNINAKIGLIISNFSMSYLDVDFYVFTVNALDEKIINQQLSFNKEVMIYILNCDDMNTIIKTIAKQDKTGMFNMTLLNDVYFINNYPEIFWKLFN